MRGSSVIGASIWDSHNRWLTIHGTDYLVVRDCVGYKSIGHGFFLEDGSETSNILDHNLAAVVGPGKALPKQLIPFDLNRGAGFWWANCQNSFTRNVAVECAEYGYRFDCKRTDDFDPVRQIRQPDGTTKVLDTRVTPFIRFQDNEAHTMRFFCLNLRGATRQERFDFYEQNKVLAREAAEAMPGRGYPFWIRDFKCWEANWSVHRRARFVPSRRGDLAFDHGPLGLPPHDDEGHPRERHSRSHQHGRARKYFAERRTAPTGFGLQLQGRSAAGDDHHASGA
jgi:hypothetical protein